MAATRSAAIPMLRGRRHEVASMEALLDAARAGQSGVLVLLGQAGIGKTALLERTIESASDFTLLRAGGVESEMELAFAALHQLCAPVLDSRRRLPVPQRDALAITFGVTAGPAPDRLLVALATLSLVSEAAQTRPLLCVIDDAQWLDGASAQVLAFIGRRLFAEPVVLLFAARETTDAFANLPALPVAGLEDGEARELLASVIAGRLDDRVMDQLVADARGNPLALLELPRGLSTAQLAGGFGLPRAQSLQSRIEQRFLQRLAVLPETTQRLLLIAAAEPLGDPILLSRAADRLGIAATARDPAESAGLIEIDTRVRFRHPLVRSAIYRAAAPDQRRGVHRALAEATDAATDPDRRAWHLAAGTVGANDTVAQELERAAGRAQARAGLAAASAFLERAAALTVDPGRRAQRALVAAQAKYEAGALADALALVDSAESGATDAAQRARVHLLRAQIAFAARRGGDAPALLLDAAREIEAVDPERARTTYLEALEAARIAGRLARGVDAADVSRAALTRAPPRRPPRPTDLLLEGMATLPLAGLAAAAPILKAALSSFRDEMVLSAEESRSVSFAFRAAADLWDEDSWRLLATRELQRARDAGALTATPKFLSTLSFIHAVCGELSTAELLLDEIRAIATATGTPAYRYIEIMLAALRGREPELSALVEDFTRDAKLRGEGFSLAFAGQASAVLYNGLGRYEEAVAAVSEVIDIAPYSELGSQRAIPELVEAATRAGAHRTAERALDLLTLTTKPGGTDWALGVEACSRALLSDGDPAEHLYQEAIARLSRTRVRVQLARTHLLYGEWLRRERRRRDARAQLHTALEMFRGMDMEGFAGRAERELLATGERARKRTVETREQLTAQEAQVARMARDGLSNVTIGERLFISQHTVAYHLRKVFTKLDITSRHQLGRALPPGG
jgi:DNA-binding CsgD family transcriptional regulator/tetratricopeptide (TPR) repeat protein